MYNRKRSYNKAFGKAASALGAALSSRMSYKRARSYTKTTRKRGTSGPGVTQQRDFRVQYVKKNMPRYKKRIWKNFKKKVDYITNSKLGTISVVFNSTGKYQSTNSGQEFGSFLLCGRGGEDKHGEVGNRDLEDISSSTPNSGSIFIRSAIFDATFTNTGLSKLEVDVYHVRYGRESQAKNLSDVYNFTSANRGSISLTVQSGTVGSTLQMSSRGATPFNFPQAISLCGMKILKKVKYFVESLETFTYQIRDPREYKIKRQETLSMANIDDGFVQPYKTQGLIVVIKTVLGNQDGQLGELTYGVTRSYTYGIAESDAVSQLALTRTDMPPPPG